MTDNATSRRFSRSPLISEVSTGLSSMTRSLAWPPTSRRSTRSGTRGGLARAAAVFAGGGGFGKTTRTSLPLSSGARGMIEIRLVAIANSPGRSARARSVYPRSLRRSTS